MFQNINEYTVQEKKEENINKWTEIMNKKNIIIYIISFMLSLVGIGGEYSLFSISILGACFSSSIPLLGVVIVTLIGNIIKFGVIRYIIIIIPIFAAMLIPACQINRWNVIKKTPPKNIFFLHSIIPK